MLPVEAVVFMVNRDADQVAADCDLGRFQFVFDISAPGSHRRELRIYRDCVLRVLNPQLLEPANLPEVFEKILPHRGLRGVEVQRTLAASLQHIRDLDDAGLIQVERERLAPSGPRASRIYSRDSIVSFLLSRAIGANASVN